MKKTEMKLLVVGDEGVGKTSLISTLISEGPNQTVRTLNKIVLPPDMCPYSKDVFTEIVDTASKELQAMDSLPQYLRKHDIILLVYDVSSALTVTRIESHWLQLLGSSPETPIILVGNKLDRIQLAIEQNIEYVPVRELLRKLIQNYKQIQMGIECSAFYDRNVKKVFSSAQRAVLYPLSPLYDITQKQITPKFKKALTRIFRVLDHDLTGKISDKQLSSLQERVFQSELSLEDIRAIRAIINSQEKQMTGLIQVTGFLAFQKKCIQMLKIQICWSILRHFDYSDKLDLRPTAASLILPANSGYSLELTPSALDFIYRLYRFAEKSKSSFQSLQEKVFQCAPAIPLQEFNDQNISLEQFMLAWYMLAFLDHRLCYESLLYTGYQAPIEETFKRTKGKQSLADLQELKHRKVFSVLLVSGGSYSDGLFRTSVSMEDLQRIAVMSTQHAKSCVLLFFRIKDQDMSHFMERNPLSRKLDLILHFGKIEEACISKVDENTMVREVSEAEAEESLKLFDLSELDLKALPVDYKPAHYERLYKLIMNTFENIQLGYSKEKMESLRRESEMSRKIYYSLGAALTVGVIALFAHYKLKGK